MAVANSDGYGRRPGICDGVSGERIISKCLFRLPTDFGNQSPFYDVGQWKLATNQAHDVFASQSWNHLQNLITLKHIFFERRHPSSNSFWWRWTTSPGKCSSNFALTHSQRQTMSWQRIWASSPRCTSFCRVMMVLRACPWDRSYGHTWSCFLFKKKTITEPTSCDRSSFSPSSSGWPLSTPFWQSPGWRRLWEVLDRQNTIWSIYGIDKVWHIDIPWCTVFYHQDWLVFNTCM